jgi:hypothetical protein
MNTERDMNLFKVVMMSKHKHKNAQFIPQELLLAVRTIDCGDDEHTNLRGFITRFLPYRKSQICKTFT